jgi:DNA-binding NarL/FixJ family response regulator
MPLQASTSGVVGLWEGIVGSVRVVVTGNGPVYRSGLCAVLPTTDREGTVAVVGEAGDFRRSQALVALLHPDVIISSLSFLDEERHPLARLLGASRRSRLLVVTDRSDRTSVRAALEDGASGYILRDIMREELLTAVRRVAAGKRHLDPRLGELTLVGLDRPRDSLSEREREVLQLLALGFTNSEVAARLVISTRTVETHRSNIQRKLGLRSRAELARAAWREGLDALLPSDTRMITTG